MIDGHETTKRGGGVLLPALLGGLFLAAAILLLASLAVSLSSFDSPLAGPGRVLREAFSWAAWVLPFWGLLAGFLALSERLNRALAFSLGASALPYLLLAALARLLDPTAAPLFPNLEAGRTPIGMLLLVSLAFLASLVLVVRLAQLFRAEEAEEGHRPGLEPAEEGEDEPGEHEILAAGRRVDSSERGSEGDREGAPDSGATGFPEAGEGTSGAGAVAPAPSVPAQSAGHYEFKVPVIPPPPRLRSLDREAAASPLDAAPSAPSLPPGQVQGQSPSGQVQGQSPSGQVQGQSPNGQVQGQSLNEPGEEPPIPLFFRVPAPGSGAPLKEGRGSGTEGERQEGEDESVHRRNETLSLEGLSKPIEFTSVPPAPPAHESEEGAKALAVARILARKKRPPYAVPVDGLLMQYPDGQYWIIDDKTRKSAEVLRQTLMEFNIEAEVTGIRKGPVITMFEILPAPGVRLSKIANLCDNIALRLAASSVRIVAPIPGKHAVGIEVPNERRSIVSLREIVESESFVSSRSEVPVALGKDIAGEVQFIDLVQTPHLLIAGSTGSGKSVCVNSIILSILFRRSPEEVRLLLIDPKIVELKLYNGVPHLLTPVITEPKRAFQALQYCICEMERRYAMLDRVGVRDIRSYNRKLKEKSLAQERMPYIVVIIDEFADLMATTGKELESTLARLAAMSRAVGIHLVLATQRPSIDVITGLIKANIPSRIAFMVASKFDSRIIIDMVGAEKLLGRGDMLFASAWDPFPIRMQGAFVSEEEVEKAVEFVKTLGEPQYIDEDIFIDDEEDEGEPNLFDDGDGDPLFEQALEIVLQQGKASASYIQRKLKIGYNRAARLVELMEEKGIVGKAQGSKPRDLVRNPEIAGLRGGAASGEVGAGSTRMSLRERGEDADTGGPLPVAGAREMVLPPLVAKLETLPGQRVTGRED